MARRPNTIAQRISLDGGEEIRKELERLGFAGQEAFKRLQKEAEKVRGPPDNFFARIRRIGADLQKAGRQFTTFGRQVSGIGVRLGAAITAPLVLAGRQIVTFGAEFEQTLNVIEARSGETASRIGEIETKIRDLGKTTEFTANEIGAAFIVLLNNAVPVEDILGGVLEASLKLASATGTDIPRAADILTDVLANFGKTAGEASGVVDQLVGASQASKFAFDDYSAAIVNAAGAASALRVPLEDVNALIAASARFFSDGAAAGTAVSTMFIRLAKDSAEARDSAERLTKALGRQFSFFDESGNLRPLVDILADLREAFQNLTEQERLDILSKLFGTRSIKSALGLVSLTADEFERVKEQIAAVDADRQVEARMKGLGGQMRLLVSAVGELQLKLGREGGLLGDLAEFVAQITEWVNSLNEADAATLKMAVQIAAVAAAIAPVLLIIGGLALAIGIILTPIGAVVAGVVVLGGAIAALAIKSETARKFLNGLWEVLKVISGFRVAKWAFDLATGNDAAAKAATAHKEALDKLDEAIDAVRKGVPGAVAAFDDLARAQLRDAQAALDAAREKLRAFRIVAEAIDPTALRPAFLDPFIAEIDEAEKRLAGLQEKIGGFGGAAAEQANQRVAGGFGVLADKAEDAGEKVDGLGDKVEKLGRTIRILGPGGVIREVAIGGAAQKAGEDVEGLDEKVEDLGRSIRLHLGGEVRDVPIAAALERAGEAADAAGEAAGRAQTPAEQLAQKIAAARETIGEFRTEASAALEAVAAKAGEARDALGEVDAPAVDWGEFDAEAARVLGGIVTAAELSVAEIEAQFAGLPPAVAAALAPLKDEATAALADVAFGATETVARLGEIAPPQLDWSGFTGAAISAFDGIVAAATGAVSAIAARFQTLPGALAGAAEEAEGGAGEAAGGGVWSRIVADAQSALAQLVALVGGLPGQLAPFWAQIAAAARAMFDGLDAFVDGVMGSVKSSIESVAAEIERIADRLVAQMKRVEAAAKAALAAAREARQASSDGGGSAFAHGGVVRGAGTATSDSIPARLSAGEFVQPTRTVGYYGLDVMELLRRRLVPRELFDAVRRLKDGGPALPTISFDGLARRIDRGAASLAPMHFATGGAVPALADGGAGGGTPRDLGRLVLSAGSEILEVFTDEGTADRLMRFTTRQRVRRAGRPPSWDRG